MADPYGEVIPKHYDRGVGNADDGVRKAIAQRLAIQSQAGKFNDAG